MNGDVFKVNVDSLDHPEYIKLVSICERIKREQVKGKIPFIIYGSGISPDVPSYSNMISKLESLVNEQINLNNITFSEEYSKLRNQYKERKGKKNILSIQQKILTYIQNAYLKKADYVNKTDMEPLATVWKQFITWMIFEDKVDEAGKKKPSLLQCEASESHKAIADLYENTGAIGITTNFDNLLSKAFKAKGMNFYPILDEESFNRYFTNIADDKSCIEIQTRGDLFWVECSGEKNKICPNIKKKCYVPEKDNEPNEEKNKLITLCNYGFCTPCGV
jgi:hypothetical protein